MRLKKPEPVDIQGICVLCGINKQVSRGGKNYRPTCSGCHNERRGLKRNHYAKITARPYKKHKKSQCEVCGFVPVHPCQLDVDHIDGDHSNNAIENLMTLCANCHRLKTFINKDWDKEKGTP